MPQLDVSDALGDPELIGRISVIRRSAKPGLDGFDVIVPTYFRNIVATVCMADQNALEMGSDESHQNKALSIIARFPLRGVAPGMQPDIVLWRGNHYKVVAVDDYSEWGPGYVRAVAHSIAAADIAAQTLPPSMGELIFTTDVNSGLIAAL